MKVKAVQIFILQRRPTPLGEMLILCDEQDVLRAVDWQDHEQRMHRLLRQQYPAIDTVVREGATKAHIGQAFEAYFSGVLGALDALAVETGGTDFQRELWQTLRAIPAGQTTSYGELARQLGRPDASRAVGQANGANPIGIVVPCHRVIGASASLTGYGGGMERKRWLLEHEGVAPQSPRQKSLDF